MGLIVFLIFGSAEPLFKEKMKNKSQAFNLDMMTDETEDCLLLSKKQKLFNENNNYTNAHTKFNGFNPAFKDDNDM